MRLFYDLFVPHWYPTIDYCGSAICSFETVGSTVEITEVVVGIPTRRLKLMVSALF